MSKLIDADAFRRELDCHWPFTKEEQSKHGIADMAKGTVLFVLNKMPAIEPERKKGKWINVNDGKWNTIEVLKCSVCGEIDNRMYKTDNFCPNCGADMKEGAAE